MSSACSDLHRIQYDPRTAETMLHATRKLHTCFNIDQSQTIGRLLFLPQKRLLFFFKTMTVSKKVHSTEAPVLADHWSYCGVCNALPAVNCICTVCKLQTCQSSSCFLPHASDFSDYLRPFSDFSDPFRLFPVSVSASW